LNGFVSNQPTTSPVKSNKKSVWGFYPHTQGE
jgi:hypothetical protein